MKKIFKVNDFAPAIHDQDISNLFREPGKQGISPALKERIDYWLEKLPGYLNPCIFYCFERIENVGDGLVRLESGATLKSKKLSRTFNGCGQAVCFIGTIGKAIEEEVKRCAREGRHADAFILDAIGSFAVENMVEQFNCRMAKECREKGIGVTLRFSPGYCDWPINEQKKLFAIFDRDQINVDLTDAFLMQPRKSISGIFALSDPAKTEKFIPYNPCKDCKKRDCPHRRTEGAGP